MGNIYDCWMTWNARLKQAFDAAKSTRGITQTDLAVACGIAPASVSLWFTDSDKKTKNIEGDKLLAACKFLRVSPFWVMFGDDKEYELAQVPPSAPVDALDLMRLISSFSMSSDAGRARILEVVEETKKLMPR